MNREYFTGKHVGRILRMHLCFFKSTVLLTLVFQSIIVILVFSGVYAGTVSGEYTNQPVLFMPLGLILDLIYKELTYKEIYYFYYNQGIRKIELWISSFCAWCGLLIIFYFILRLCVNAWKLIA